MNRQERIRKFKKEYKSMVKDQNFMFTLPLTEDEQEFLPIVYENDRRHMKRELMKDLKITDMELFELLKEIKINY